MSVLSVKTNINMEKRKMSDETKLLTPDDEEIKKFIARKYRRKWSQKEYEKRMARLYDDCDHPSVKFFEEDCTFRCMKCNEKLVQCDSINDFRLFCFMSGKDPESLLV